MIPLFLVCVGLRVPDISRPHKPKPMRRAVLEETPSRIVIKSVVKIDPDPIINTLPAIVSLPSEGYSPEAHPSYLSIPFLSLKSFPPRAPPVSNPIA
jgi:hypothetical protein